MIDTEDKIIEILHKLPSEGPNLDYKEMPYHRHQDINFIKDVIAMLNSEAVMDKDKFIICGVDNSKKLKGIKMDDWRDDNEWQNLLLKISPRPVDVRTGTVRFDNKIFGYIYISNYNNEWVYEAAVSIFPGREQQAKECNTLFKGQALTRRGSKNETLYSRDRQRLLEKKIQTEHSGEKVVIIDSSYDENLMGVLGLLGGWNEKYEGDQEAVEYITGLSSEALIEKLRRYRSETQSILQFSNGTWTIKNHAEVLLKESDKIYDNHIDAFFTCIKKCFCEIDAKYGLNVDKRYSSSYLNSCQKSKYSRTINRGLAETLAILGNNIDSFVNCSENKIINELCVFLRGFFEETDWRIYASETDNLQAIGEACPGVFLDEIIKLTNEKDNAFSKLLNKKEKSISITQYGYQLSWVISNIAKLEQYFSKAMLALFQMARINDSFIDAIVGVVLPWYPQTHAPIAIRIGVFNGLAAEDDSLTWKILMKLMPRVTTTGSPIMKPKYLKVEDIPETISRKDYIDATLGYINIALDISGNNVNRLCDLLPVIDDVDDTIQKKIIARITEAIENISQEDKKYLWNKIQDFLLKHRKFSDASWALGEERLQDMDELAARVLPDSDHTYAVRLFREDQYSLLEEIDNYNLEENKLRNKQTEILRALYKQNGVKGIAQFAAEVENKSVVGECLSRFVENNDIQYIISKSECIEKDELVKNLFINLGFERIVEVICDESDDVQAKVLSFLALTKKTIDYINTLNEEAQSCYWKMTQVWGFGTDSSEIYQTAVKNLNAVGRSDKSIFILYSCLQAKIEGLRDSLVVDTLNLKGELTSSEAVNAIGEYYIQNLIKWLQNQRIDKETMIKIEWNYLDLMQEREGYPPIYLWNELSSNPYYFIKIIKRICGKEDLTSRDDDEKTRIVSRCYNLIYSWKKVPGVSIDGTFDKEKLDEWMSVVSIECKKYDIEAFALNCFGQVAFYSPKDADGFFIERNVANYLQNDKEGNALAGYFTEALNSRGVYSVDPTGQAEFTIEAEYNKKANLADEAGMFRLAETLRRIARAYHEEGKQNIKYGNEYYSE